MAEKSPYAHNRQFIISAWFVLLVPLVVWGVIYLAKIWGPPPAGTIQSPDETVPAYVTRLAGNKITFGRDADIEILIYRDQVLWGYLDQSYIPHSKDEWEWRFGAIARRVPAQIKEPIIKATKLQYPEKVRQNVSVLVDFLRLMETAAGLRDN